MMGCKMLIKIFFSRQKTQILVGIAFIFLVSAIAHILFSQLGFNPTDDGFILAGSRRILDGQVPHRDFISIRPAGSYFLHTPFVLFGGDYTLWVSRYFVWFQLACIAWAWTVVASNLLKIFRSATEKFVFALIVFCFSAHTFPIMAWPTIDTLFVYSIGVLLCHKQYKKSKSNLRKMIGYLLIGVSLLFRQNFLLTIPASLIIFNDWRQKRYWLVAGLPLIFYIGYLMINVAVSDAILQLTTYTFEELLIAGVLKYIFISGTAWGILTGYLATSMAYGDINLNLNLIRIVKNIVKNTTRLRMIGVLMLFGIALSVAGSLAAGEWFFIRYPSFAIFGSVVGAMAYFMYKEQKLTPLLLYGALVLIVAWSVSLSAGYRTPALFSGPLVLFLIGCAKGSSILHSSQHLLYVNILIVLLLITTLVAFGIARENYVYRDMPASKLAYDLAEVLPGAKSIKTNNNTYNFLKDLQVAKSMATKEGKEYCIIPDVAANWIKSSQPNPLSADWPQSTELGSQKLIDRVIGDLRTNRGRVIVIVQKYEAYLLASGLTPLSGSYAIVQYVTSNFNKTGETQFFNLYE